MPNNKRITPAQERILDRFTCQRLTDDPANRHLSWDFFSARGESLADTLKSDAWYEDSEGLPAAYYVVKAPSGRIAMFFSLKCGTLCDPSYVARVTESYEQTEKIMDELGRMPSRKAAFDYLERVRTSSAFPVGMTRSELFDHFRDARENKRWLRKDKKTDPSDKIIRVDVAFPAIELVHFCVNDLVRSEWKSFGLGRSMGETLFWRFVLPKMLQINRLIGCEYVYLFAADTSRDGTLINYYENALHFERPTAIGAVKPQYDFLCTFLCKRLFRLSPYRREYLDPAVYEGEDPLGLVDHQKAFFENFNETPGMV